MDALEMAEALEDALTVHGDKGRKPIQAWLLDAFGPQLLQRRKLAGGTDEEWDPESSEPISTSAMVRRDPTGQMVALPAHLLDDEEEVELSAARPWLRPALLIAGALFALLAAGLVGAWIATSG